MKNNHKFQKKFGSILKISGLYLWVIIKVILNFILTKRTILFVSDQKIRKINFSPLLQMSLLTLSLFIGNVFVQSLQSYKIIKEKSDEVEHLKSLNSYFENEFESVNNKLKKLTEYMYQINNTNYKEVNDEKIEGIQFKKSKKLDQDQLSRQDKKTIKNIEESLEHFSEMHLLTQKRIKKIEKAISMVGLNIKNSDNLKSFDKIISNNNYGRGGPEKDDQKINQILTKKTSEEDALNQINSLKFNNEIDYLMVLEHLASVLPLSEPMNSYYISSGFGMRSDPITNRKTLHHGLDFVGLENEKIYSPSSGKVILAGKFSEYGNAIVIDHGFGITTRYGHLSSIKVKEGQVVKKGENIALQGNTGRSTGDHLHYEVRYKNIPLNPKKFLEAGQILFNNQQNIRHVNS